MDRLDPSARRLVCRMGGAAGIAAGTLGVAAAALFAGRADLVPYASTGTLLGSLSNLSNQQWLYLTLGVWVAAAVLGLAFIAALGVVFRDGRDGLSTAAVLLYLASVVFILGGLTIFVWTCPALATAWSVSPAADQPSFVAAIATMSSAAMGLMIVGGVFRAFFGFVFGFRILFTPVVSAYLGWLLLVASILLLTTIAPGMEWVVAPALAVIDVWMIATGYQLYRRAAGLRWRPPIPGPPPGHVTLEPS